MTVPVVDRDRNPDHLLLSASGTVAGSDNKFKDEMKIQLLSKWIETDVTFIQTDKPVYKPGQLGKHHLQGHTYPCAVLSTRTKAPYLPYF